MFQCRDIDALMMDWLYGELAPQKAQSFSTHVEGCSRCHDELAAYQRTRELVSGLPSEEPPAALSAMLIREAASRSPSVRSETAQGGFLAWLGKLFQPLQHPALAAVATLVLVAGVAGTLYLRDGDQHFAEPEIATPAETASPSSAAVADESDENEIADVEELAPPPPTDGTKGGEDPGRRADLLEGKKKEVAADLLVKSTKKDSPVRKKRSNQKRKPKLDDSFRANVVSGADPLPVDEKKPAESESAFAGSESTSDRPYRAYRDRPDAWVDAQQLRITEAYNRNDCQTAARIANDILDRSPELYTKRTRNLEAVKRCQVYVKRERSRRAVVRKQRSTSSGKAAGKAKVAPRPAPAADLESAD